MTCTCGNLQCYVCSLNVHDYSHFNRGGGLSDPEKCPLYGDMELLLSEQVADAQERTINKLLGAGTGLEDNDIRVDKNLKAKPLAFDLAPTVHTPPRVFTRCFRCGALQYEDNIIDHICMPYSCVQCDWNFGTAVSLSQHQKDKHGTNNINDNTTCGTCGKSFKSIASLSQHVKASQHRTDTRCRTCRKVFGSERSLAQHQRDTGHGSLKRNHTESQISHSTKRRRIR